MPITQTYLTILVLDIEQSSRAGDDQILVRLRRGLRGVLEQALTNAEIDTRYWVANTTGDGLLVEFNPNVQTAKIVRLLLDHVSAELGEHNRHTAEATRIRVRAVVHAAHMLHDEQGIVSQELTRAFRLLNSDALRAELRQAPGPLVAAVSDAVYLQVVQQRALGLDPDRFRPVQAETKETSAEMWVHLPASGSGAPPPGEMPGPRQPRRRHLGKLLGLTVAVVAAVAVIAALASRTSPPGDDRPGNASAGTTAPVATTTTRPDPPATTEPSSPDETKPESPSTTDPRSPGATGCGAPFEHVMPITGRRIEVRYCADWAPPGHDIPVNEKASQDSPVVGHILAAEDDWYSCQLTGGRYELDGYGYQSEAWVRTLADNNQWGYVSQIYLRGGEDGEPDADLEGC